MRVRRRRPAGSTLWVFRALALASFIWAIFGLLDRNGPAIFAGVLGAIAFLGLGASVHQEHWPADGGESRLPSPAQEREAHRASEPWPESPPPTVPEERRTPPP